MTQELNSLDLESIVDLLAQKTQRFTQMLMENTSEEEYKNLKEAIEEIVAEIKSRQSVSTSETNIDFQKPDTT